MTHHHAFTGAASQARRPLVLASRRIDLPEVRIPPALLRANGDENVLRAAAAQGQGGQPSEVRQLVGELVQAHQDFKAKHDERLDYIQASFDDLTRRVSGLAINGGGAPDAIPSDPAYTRTFAQFVRTGQGEDEVRRANAEGERAQIRAAMTVGSNSDGGYLAPVEWDRLIRSALVPSSPIRALSQVIATSVGAYTSLWTDAALGSGWVGEVAARPSTSTPQFIPITFEAGEIYANPQVSQRLLDDSAINLDQWLSEQVVVTFSRQEGIAFLSGNGTNKPLGILQYLPGGVADATVANNPKAHPGGNIATVNTGSAAAITGDGFVDMVFSLGSEYRQGASWLMNSTTAAAASKLKDGQGNYLWRDNYQLGQPQTLLGYPVAIDENMASIAAGNIPVIFGNFRRGYLVNDRTGVRILRNPFRNPPFVELYCTRRVGGWVQDPNAFRCLKVSA
jgi:HK97 family phage major capsid protein